jgi:flagellar basal body L-ring protein FlgH
MRYVLVALTMLCHQVVFAKVDPLEKISIKSVRAYTTPLKNQPGFYLVRYEQDVHVDLADKTKMTGDVLEVVVARKAMASSAKKDDVQKVTVPAEQVKSVVMKGNVRIDRFNHTVRADKAELLVTKKQCCAQGNVHIVQRKSSVSDIPVVIDSERAVLDLLSEKLLLVGTDKAPVSTVFELKGAISKGKKLV